MINIPVDLPASFSNNISFANLEAKVADLSPAMNIIKETWDAQTFANLEKGVVIVPDQVMNQSLAGAIAEQDQVTELTVQSLGDGKLKITALTKKAGHLVLTCKIEQFQHDSQHSVMRLKVLDKKLPDKPMLSWIFSKVSLAMATKFAGNVNTIPGMVVELKGNSVTVDFHQALYQSRFGSAELFGYKPLDVLIIREATVQQGAIAFSTALDTPDKVKDMLRNLFE